MALKQQKTINSKHKTVSKERMLLSLKQQKTVNRKQKTFSHAFSPWCIYFYNDHVIAGYICLPGYQSSQSIGFPQNQNDHLQYLLDNYRNIRYWVLTFCVYGSAFFAA